MRFPIVMSVFVRILSLVILISLCRLTRSKETNGRDERLLPMFKLVRIPHQLCRPNLAFIDQMGSCYSSKECREVGGTVSGTCAQGYGVCCLVRETCTSGEPVTVNINGTHLLSPTMDLRDAMTCQYRFPRPRGVCQLRLDFVRFESDQSGPNNLSPNPNGDCNADTLRFTGASNAMNLGALCGNLTGQHVYLDYGNGNEIDAFMFTALAQTAQMQGWDIQVTYIKCDSTERAPTGCLQYFTEQAGTVTSFNYNGRQQLNNEDYSICVKTIPGMNRITWTPCGNFDEFFVSGTPPIPSPAPGIPPLLQPARGDMCPLDWVMIFGVDKFCGSGMNMPAVSMTQPFVVQVHFQEYELGPPGDPNGVDDRNRGFCLMYQQSP